MCRIHLSLAASSSPLRVCASTGGARGKCAAFSASWACCPKWTAPRCTSRATRRWWPSCEAHGRYNPAARHSTIVRSSTATTGASSGARRIAWCERRWPHCVVLVALQPGAVRNHRAEEEARRRPVRVRHDVALLPVASEVTARDSARSCDHARLRPGGTRRWHWR